MARKSDDHDGSKGPGPQRDPQDVRRIERLERDKAKLIEERDHWKRRSEHLEKELEAARRAGKRQAAPFAKDRPQGTAGGRGGEPARSTGSRDAAESRHELTRRMRRRPRRPVPTAATRSRWTVWRRSIRKTCRRCVPSCGASTSRWATARSVSGACRAGTPCRPPTRWARPARSWVRTSPSSTPSWACRWRRSSAFCRPGSACT